MSPATIKASGGTDGFPRVSGDEPWEVLEADFQMTFSPRERG